MDVELNIYCFKMAPSTPMEDPHVAQPTSMHSCLLLWLHRCHGNIKNNIQVRLSRHQPGFHLSATQNLTEISENLQKKMWIIVYFYQDHMNLSGAHWDKQLVILVLQLGANKSKQNKRCSNEIRNSQRSVNVSWFICFCCILPFINASNLTPYKI